MTSLEKIRRAFDRTRKAMSLKPAVARGTAVTKVTLRDGLTCDFSEGDWHATADMSRSEGGSELGPTPGFFGRGAFGSCLMIGCMIEAAKLGIPIDGLEIEVQADYDARAEYGLADLPPGYSELRYLVKIASPAPREDIERMLDLAEAHGSYHRIFSHPVPLKRALQVTAAAA